MKYINLKIKRLNFVKSTLLLILFISLAPQGIAAKTINEDESSGQFISHGQPLPGDRKNEGGKFDAFSVGFIMLSLGTFFCASSASWLYQKRKSLMESQSSATAFVNDQTTMLKRYLDSAHAVKNFELNVIFADLTVGIEQLRQRETILKVDLAKLAAQETILRAAVAKVFERIIRRCL